MLAARMTKNEDQLQLCLALRPPAEGDDSGEPREKKIAVLTSGGDSQGMNAALRGIVRVAIYAGCSVFFVKEGYKGLLEGGEMIIPATWSSVSDIMHKGGTVIGSTRNEEFKEREGRVQAVCNLVQAGINYLVVVGGDGSLTGALLLHDEWPQMLQELMGTGRITQREASMYGTLQLVGLAASIDNDFHGTDMTIGCDTALHRIVEATDSIASTASSHQRCFIMEVMGRNCGYLTLKSAMASEADYVFIPELPEPENWQETLCEKLKYERKMGKRMNIVMVCEGAQDSHGQHITSQMVLEVVETTLKYDTRLTVLGHVQRGGRPSAFDRILATRMGAEAVRCLLDPEEQGQEPKVISLQKNALVRADMAASIKGTQEENEALRRQDSPKSVEMRGRSFGNNVQTYKMLNAMIESNPEETPKFTVGVLHVGQPACGMNAVVATLVRMAAHLSVRILGFHNGVEGLAAGNFEELSWKSVDGWVPQGGAKLYTDAKNAEGLEKDIANTLETNGVQALIIVGGFQAYVTALQMFQGRQDNPQLCVPVNVIPSSISNRIPGTDFSVGADTALNELTAMCDRLRLSAQGTFKRNYVTEVMGKHCGYLATMGGIASGADQSYIFEEPLTLNDLQTDVNHMKIKMERGDIVRGLVIRNEEFNPNFSTKFIYQLFAEEGKEVFTTRMLILGPLQEGVSPTPFDRDLAIKLAASAIKWTVEQLESGAGAGPDSPQTATLTGIVGKEYCHTPVTEIEENADFTYEIPKTQWWMKFRQLAKIVATFNEAYENGKVSLESLET
ncbi:ATP-dependent 6-phosphofructokinase-like [Bacillus rossius redtenbacheri]|uniref:ATP-dependent 6-phosphofructokinase-like n=1 Tax=Bacillus rossius redtenbacheri TaxID=93214 RepID=UPI002FDDF9DD